MVGEILIGIGVIGLLGVSCEKGKGHKEKDLNEEYEKDYTGSYTRLFENLSIIDSSKGDWIKCYGFKEHKCYKTITFKLSDTLSAKDFIKIQGKIAEKLQIKEDKFQIYTEKGYMKFKIINEEFPIMGYKKMNLPTHYIPLGYNLENELETLNLCSDPHILVGGVPTSGKSILQHVIICHLLESTKSLLWLVDLKAGLEFSRYRGIDRVRAYGQELEQSKEVIQSFFSEMERRFAVLEKANIQKYEDYIEVYGDQDMPRSFLIVDEFADLMMLIPRGKGKEKEYNIMTDLVMIGRKSRAVGMHMILASQRMNANSIDTDLKNVCTGRIGLRASSEINSSILIDHGGLEKLQNYQAIVAKEGREVFIRTINMDMKYLEKVIKRYTSKNKKQSIKEEKLIYDSKKIFKG